jgi:hypothetical protein
MYLFNGCGRASVPQPQVFGLAFLYPTFLHLDAFQFSNGNDHLYMGDGRSSVEMPAIGSKGLANHRGGGKMGMNIGLPIQGRQDIT